MENNNNKTGIWIGSIALVLATLGLTIGWAAFNRSGKDVSTVVSQQTQEFQDESEEAAMEAEQAAEEAENEIEYAALRLELEARLLTIQANLAAEENLDEAVAEIQDLRSDLAIAYKTASMQAREEIRELDTELENVEQNARNNTAEALRVLEGAIELVRKDVITNEE